MDLGWATLFSYTIWSLWSKWSKRKERRTLLVRIGTRDLVFQAISLANELNAAAQIADCQSIEKRKEIVHISWQPTPVYFVKLKTDGSSISASHAAAGGFIRDWNGSWIVTFHMNIGSPSPLCPELWG